MSKNINTYFTTESISEVQRKATLKERGESPKLFIEKRSTCTSLIYSVKYDGIVNSNNSEKKADYLVVNNIPESPDHKTIEIYICELKGQDINNAHEQLLATFNQLKGVAHNSVIFKGIIVGSKIPRITIISPTSTRRKLLKLLNNELKLCSSEYTLLFH